MVHPTTAGNLPKSKRLSSNRSKSRNVSSSDYCHIQPLHIHCRAIPQLVRIGAYKISPFRGLHDKTVVALIITALAKHCSMPNSKRNMKQPVQTPNPNQTRCSFANRTVCSFCISLLSFASLLTFLSFSSLFPLFAHI